MNLPDEIFQVMQSVGPAEIRKLSQNDSMRLGFIGDDPAYEEARIAAEARRYGLNSAEYRARQEKTGATCLQQLGTLPTDLAADLEYHRQCGRIKDAIMWGTDVETARRIEDAVVQHCAGPIETPDWDACMKEVGQAIKVGQPLSPPKPLVPMAHPLPPGFEYVDK